jgi:hypothetical protein
MSDFTITVSNDGPLRLEGAIRILHEGGRAWGLAGRSTCEAAELPPPAAKA